MSAFLWVFPNWLLMFSSDQTEMNLISSSHHVLPRLIIVRVFSSSSMVRSCLTSCNWCEGPNHPKSVFILQTNRFSLVRTEATSFDRTKIWSFDPEAPFSPAILVRTKLKCPKVRTKWGRCENALNEQIKAQSKQYLLPHCLLWMLSEICRFF